MNSGNSKINLSDKTNLKNGKYVALSNLNICYTWKKSIKDENCDITLSNDLKISSLKEDIKDINTKKVKEKIKAEYLRRTEKFFIQNSIVEISSKL